jgi:hypothetical protein
VACAELVQHHALGCSWASVSCRELRDRQLALQARHALRIERGDRTARVGIERDVVELHCARGLRLVRHAQLSAGERKRERRSELLGTSLVVGLSTQFEPQARELHRRGGAARRKRSDPRLGLEMPGRAFEYALPVQRGLGELRARSARLERETTRATLPCQLTRNALGLPGELLGLERERQSLGTQTFHLNRQSIAVESQRTIGCYA